MLSSLVVTTLLLSGANASPIAPFSGFTLTKQPTSTISSIAKTFVKPRSNIEHVVPAWQNSSYSDHKQSLIFTRNQTSNGTVPFGNSTCTHTSASPTTTSPSRTSYNDTNNVLITSAARVESITTFLPLGNVEFRTTSSIPASTSSPSYAAEIESSLDGTSSSNNGLIGALCVLVPAVCGVLARIVQYLTARKRKQFAETKPDNDNRRNKHHSIHWHIHHSHTTQPSLGEPDFRIEASPISRPPAALLGA